MIYLYRWAENEIFLKTLFFSNTDNRRYPRHHSLIECLQVIWMYVTIFSFHSKLVLEKAKKPASYELAIHTVFFLNILRKCFKRVLWIFSNEYFDRLHFTKFSIATREFYIWEVFISSKKPLLAGIPVNFSPWHWI